LSTEINLPKQVAGERRERVQSALGHAPFDAVVLASPESISYVAGFRSVSASVFSDYLMAAVVSPTQLMLVVGAGEVAAALDSGVSPDELFAYGSFFFEGDHVGASFANTFPDFPAAMSAAISALAIPKSFLAVESPMRNAAVLSGVTEHAVDATEWLMALRAVKLPGEQHLLRTAVSIAEDGIRAGIESIAVGVTERDIARRVAATMAARGGTPRFVVVTSGERSALSDAFPSERAVAPGDLVRFDIGCEYEGYWSDIARTAVLGPPSRRQATYYEALRAGVAAEVDGIATGLTAGALFDIAVRTVRANGIDTYRRHHVGHAIGLSVYERPVIAADAPTVLQAGMVFCLETPFYELGWGGMMLEDAGVLTDDGFELFTTLDRQLAVVPL
jgi:Xaa-Pro dipeptidase